MGTRMVIKLNFLASTRWISVNFRMNFNSTCRLPKFISPFRAIKRILFTQTATLGRFINFWTQLRMAITIISQCACKLTQMLLLLAAWEYKLLWKLIKKSSHALLRHLTSPRTGYSFIRRNESWMLMWWWK